MHTIAGARAWALEVFKQSGVESSALAAELLLGFVLGRDRVYVLSHKEEALNEELLGRFSVLAQRHAEGEPLQYLIGEREFFGLDFRVTPAVLIPRPETEVLVEAVLRIVQSGLGPEACFVDVGTGSGCIAVSIAYAIPEIRGWATDISWHALEIASGNAARHHVSGRVQCIRADMLECFRREPVFDLVLSNPPYVSLEEYDTLASGVKDYEPRGALIGGVDGLDFYRRLASEASERLKSDGYLFLEVGQGQAGGVERLMRGEGLVAEEILKDLQGIPRCLVMRKNSRNG
jgi:release factor glutamine methyltransferase